VRSDGPGPGDRERDGGHGQVVRGRDQRRRPGLGNAQTIASDQAIPTGKVLLSAAFVKDGDAMPTTGTLSLFIDDEKVGEGRIMTQPGNFSLVGEGLNVGKDPGEPVTADDPGTSPFAFTWGRIVKAIVDVSGEPFIDLEKEAVAMMARE
jgi:hypothetical protein